jgi:hypothetical protein
LIAVRRESFFRISGFDESVLVGEDADFLRRLSLLGRVRFDSSQHVTCSTRRLRSEGSRRYLPKVVVWAVLRLVGSRRSVVEYRWQRYDDSLAALDSEVLALGPDWKARTHAV